MCAVCRSVCVCVCVRPIVSECEKKTMGVCVCLCCKCMLWGSCI